MTASKDGFVPTGPLEIETRAGEVTVVDVTLRSLPGEQEGLRSIPRASGGPLPPFPEESGLGPYRQFPVLTPPGPPAPPPVPMAEESKVFTPVPNRWQYDFPKYRRYPGDGEMQYVEGHWYDPFNRNKAKGDYPISATTRF